MVEHEEGVCQPLPPATYFWAGILKKEFLVSILTSNQLKLGTRVSLGLFGVLGFCLGPDTKKLKGMVSTPGWWQPTHIQLGTLFKDSFGNLNQDILGLTRW